jgi:hypothetical protein
MFPDEAYAYRVECLTFETTRLNFTRIETNIFSALVRFSVYISFNRVRGCGNKRFKRNYKGLLKEFLGFHISRFIYRGFSFLEIRLREVSIYPIVCGHYEAK